MTRFLRRLALFSIAFLVLSTLLHLFSSRLLLSQLVIARLDSEFRVQAAASEILVLGDSQAGAAWPSKFGSGFTFAFGGQTPIHTRHILARSLAQLSQLDLLIVQADSHTYSGPRLEDLGLPVFWVRYLDYPGLALELRRPGLLVDWVRGNWMSYAGESLRLRLAVAARSAATGAVQELEGLGEARADTFASLSPSERQRAGAIRVEWLLGDSPIESAMIDAVQATLSTAGEHRIEVVLVSYPVAREVLNEIPLATLRKVDAITRRIEKNPGVLVWLDYRALFADRPELFANANHLNLAGKRLFTRRIAADLRRRGIVSQEQVDDMIGAVAETR